MAAPVELPAGRQARLSLLPDAPSAGARSTTALHIGGAGANAREEKAAPEASSPHSADGRPARRRRFVPLSYAQNLMKSNPASCAEPRNTILTGALTCIEIMEIRNANSS